MEQAVSNREKFVAKGTYKITIDQKSDDVHRYRYSGVHPDLPHLINTQTLSDNLDAFGKRVYLLKVGPGASEMEMTLTVGAANLDIYAKQGAYPTNTDFDWRGTQTRGYDEYVNHASPAESVWYLVVQDVEGDGGNFTLNITTDEQEIVPVFEDDFETNLGWVVDPDNTDFASTGEWQLFSTDISAYAGQSIYIQVEAADWDNPSLVEAGIDDLLIELI